MRFVGSIAVIGALALGYWAWDGSHHDHDMPHGAPVAASTIEKAVRGFWTDEDGETMDVSEAACSPGEEGEKPRAEKDVHFRCELLLDDGSRRSRLIHALVGDEMMMRD